MATDVVKDGSKLGRQKKTQVLRPGFWYKSLAIPYFRMANCHTIIGAKRFHFRVRDGIGWFTLAMVTKQTGVVDCCYALSTVFGVCCRTPLEICNNFFYFYFYTFLFLHVLVLSLCPFFLFFLFYSLLFCVSLAVASDSVFWLSLS